MKRAFLYLVGLLIAAGVCALLMVAFWPGEVARKAGLLVSLGLLLTACVAFIQHSIVAALRRWVRHLPLRSLALPLTLLAPYLIYAVTTETFGWDALGRLALYAVAPSAILLVGRREPYPPRITWPDGVAMLAVAAPVPAGWFGGIWTWPVELGFFWALFALPVGAYAFMVVRELEDVGYRLGWRRGDWADGLVNFAVFGMIAIPLGMALGFIELHAGRGSALDLITSFFVIYLTIAIPEEFLFRGVLQNLLAKTFRKGTHALLVASVIFGLSHFHHAPMPNWKYMLMATLAGVFYGNAFRTRKRLSAAALTHALVNTVWRFWF